MYHSTRACTRAGLRSEQKSVFVVGTDRTVYRGLISIGTGRKSLFVRTVVARIDPATHRGDGKPGPNRPFIGELSPEKKKVELSREKKMIFVKGITIFIRTEII